MSEGAPRQRAGRRESRGIESEWRTMMMIYAAVVVETFGSVVSCCCTSLKPSLLARGVAVGPNDVAAGLHGGRDGATQGGPIDAVRLHRVSARRVDLCGLPNLGVPIEGDRAVARLASLEAVHDVARAAPRAEREVNPVEVH